MSTRTITLHAEAARLDHFIAARLAEMARRPAAWGGDRSDLGLQLVLLVEVWCILHGLEFDRDRTMRSIFGRGPDCSGPLDDEWVRDAVEAVQALTETRS